LIVNWCAFADTNITSVWLPDNTQKVEGAAFYNKDQSTIIKVCVRKSEYYNEDNFASDNLQTCYMGKDVPDEEWAKLAWQGYHFTFSEEDAAEITGLSSSGSIKIRNGDTNLIVPAQDEDGNAITSVGKDAFREKAVTKVTVPDSITSIGEGAFATSSDAETAKCIKSAKLSASLTEIAPKLFENQLLTEIDIPSGVKTIGESAFSGNPLKTLTLPEGVTSIGKESFLNHQLQEITIPASVKIISESAFARNTVPRNRTIQKITLSEGLESIGAKAFSQALTSTCTTIDLPTTVTSLDSTAFDGSKSKVTLYSKVADQAKGTGEYAEVATDSSSYEIVYLPKVTFDAAGGTCDTTQVRLDRDRKLSQLPTATREGYSFDGWYTEAQGGDPVKSGSDSAEYTEDTTLYAHWTKTSQDVTPAVTLSAGTYTYDGKVKTPAVTVKVDGQTMDQDTYDVSYDGGRTNVGTYKVTVTMKGKYEGSGSATFKINPKGTSLTKLKKAKKALTATWKKQTAQTTGYQVQYATAQNFKSVKTKTVTSNQKTSLTVKSLKSKKKYYVRIRTYKTVSGTKYYSAWSGARSVKTK
ncbi:MAG: leucine-rich repeat protein, partial [Phoenicibacter congonensis]|nr:leucine-rich repeat protein [Phoenicibacter congonensis]